MKKTVAGLLACMFLFCALIPFAMAVYVSSASIFVSGYYTCEMINYNSAAIVTYSGEEASVTIPAELGGIRIIAIRPNAFQANIELIDLVIPEGTVSSWLAKVNR